MVMIKELQSEKEILAAFPVVKQLRTHLDESEYLEFVIEAQEKDRYKMLALFEEDEIVAVIGFKPMVTLYYGRFVWVLRLSHRSEKNVQKGTEKSCLHMYMNGQKTIIMNKWPYLQDYKGKAHIDFMNKKWTMKK